MQCCNDDFHILCPFNNTNLYKLLVLTDAIASKCYFESQFAKTTKRLQKQIVLLVTFYIYWLMFMHQEFKLKLSFLYLVTHSNSKAIYMIDYINTFSHNYYIKKLYCINKITNDQLIVGQGSCTKILQSCCL